MTQSRPRFFDEYTDRTLLAASVGLSEDQLLPDGLPAQVVSTAVPQLMVPARSLRHMDKIELDLVAMRKVLGETRTDSFMLFTRECVHQSSTVHARMFAPALGVAEDPATGSASGALGAYLVHRGLGDGRSDGTDRGGAGLRDGPPEHDSTSRSTPTSAARWRCGSGARRSRSRTAGSVSNAAKPGETCTSSGLNLI